jgi:hypothetical protein
VLIKNTVIYLVNNATYILVISIKNSATYFGSLNHHQAKYQNTVLEYSASVRARAPSCTVFWYLAWWWFSDPKLVAKFLILITIICCVIDWENYYCVLYYCHRVSTQLQLTNILNVNVNFNILKANWLCISWTNKRLVTEGSLLKSNRFQEERKNRKPLPHSQMYTQNIHINTLRTGLFKLFKRSFPGFITILTL